MGHHARDDRDELAERTTRLLSHLDGALDASMLDAIQGAWSMLERTATDSPAHARAVRSRLLWETVSPASFADPLPVAFVHDLVPTWGDEDEALPVEAADVQPLDEDVAEAA